MKNKLSKIPKSVMTLALLVIVGAGFGIAALASASTISTTAMNVMQPGMHFRGAPGVRGTVSGVNGTTLTVTSTNPMNSAVTTYMVDASNAKILKFSSVVPATLSASMPQAPTNISVSSIAIGDTVNIRGTISGTTVTATEIMDGLMMPGGNSHWQRGPENHGAMGTITAVNGSTVTITGKNGSTYTINASNAKLEKISSISVSDLAVGDTISANGTVSGTSITANNILDDLVLGGLNK